jgi:hypothetical protein
MATRKPTKKLTRIPALTRDRLELAKQAISALAIETGAKQAIVNMIAAASNPDAEHPAVVLKTLEQDRQDNAQAFMKQIGASYDGARERGKRALLDMSDDEWAALVDEANSEG